jgi:ABC-type antimicrobial peptide transport system permease subunit
LLTGFAVVALSLALFGVFSTTSYLVKSRMREIGIRMAVGAHKGDILRLFLRNGARTALVGTLAGLGAAFMSMRILASLLFEVQPTDPAIYLVSGSLLLVTTIAACFFPAHGASRIDPITVLRLE